jgi:futalosine hydrolase
MPHILVVAATAHEIQPLLEKYSIVHTGEGLLETYINEKDQLSVLITGVGMVNTAYWMGRLSENYYDFVINAGICGSFQPFHPIGDVLRVYEDQLSEMGAEDGPVFLRYNDIQLGGTSLFKDHPGIYELPAVKSLALAKGITVNTVHGHEPSIEKTKLLFQPDVESMEGAAFFSGCRRFSNYVQIRAVSNYVEKRDKSKWNIPLAIQNLNQKLLLIIEQTFYAD